MDDALAHGLVEGLAGRAGSLGGGGSVAGGRGLTELAHVGLEGGLDGLVAQPRLLIGAVALDLRLDVRHGAAFGSGGAGLVMFGMVAATGARILTNVDFKNSKNNLFVVAISIGLAGYFNWSIELLLFEASPARTSLLQQV